MNKKVKHVEVGEDFTIISDDEGALYVLGSNQKDQIGIGTQSSPLVEEPVKLESLTNSACIEHFRVGSTFAFAIGSTLQSNEHSES